MFQESEDKFTAVANTQSLVADTVKDVFDVVCSTMGPDGQVVVIQEGTAVKTTKDGATVARSLEFKNLHQDKINQIIAEAARKTELECGDGTTTTIFLTKYYYDLFRKYPGFIFRRQIERITAMLIEELKKKAVLPVIGSAELRHVANITANQDQSIVDTVLKIYDDYQSPEFDLQEGNSFEDKVSKRNGLRMRMSLADSVFTENRNGQQTTFTGMHFAVVNQNFGGQTFDTRSFAETTQELAKRYPGAKIGIVVTQASTAFCGNVMAVNSLLKQQGSTTEFVVFSTNLGGTLGGLIMGDFAAALNADLVSSFTDLLSITLRQCEERVVSNLNYTVMETIGPDTQKRIDVRIEEIERTLNDMNAGARFSPMGKSTQTRKQQLAGQVVTVYVGGETLSDIKERKDRFEDVSLAVKSALVNGVLPGCGMALREAGYEVYKQLEGGDVDQALLGDVLAVCYAQWIYLTQGDQRFVNASVEDLLAVPAQYGREIINLATGQKGSPEELGVFDTAYASITALKGGMTTAKILANTSSIILGNRSGAVYFDSK